MKKLIRIGQISYINCLVFNYPLDLLLKGDSRLVNEIKNYKKLQELGYELETIQGVPSELNSLLNENKLDIAPISSFEFLRHNNLETERYKLIPKASISSIGKVKSVIFFSNTAIEELKTINISNESASSVGLLKILLKEKYGHDLSKLEFHKFSGYGDELENKLLIGDKALEKIQKDDYKYALDLGEEWYQFTDTLPMVFGLWAHRLEDNSAELVSDLVHELKDYALKNLLEDIIIEAYRKTGISKKVLYDYYNELNFDFSEKHEKALKKYEAYLLENDIIKQAQNI
ncbi:MAG: menaquinone biosynthesis protein [Candidatus Caenarcaniphilales bacterium]|nr:menaquinone biosynthesis protein [Candidatus Caenarcaniphilales bacterium]